VNASARNVVQSTLRRFIRLSRRGVQVFVHNVRFRKFICEVEARPPLYIVQLKEYSNREVKATCWAEIGKAKYEDWGTVSSSYTG